MTPVPLSNRLAIALVAAVAMGGFVAVTWGIIGFGLAASLRGVKSETVGFSVIIVAPLGATVAAVVAFGVGMIPYGSRPWLRWVIVAAASLFAGAGMFAAIAA